MAYSHWQHEIELFDAAIATTGEKGDWAPGVLPVRIRAIAACISVASATTTNAVITFYTNKLGTTTTTARTTVDTITIPGAAAVGKVYYVRGLNVEVSPGQELQGVVTTAATSTGTVNCKVLLEPRWEEPGNDTDMVASA